VAAAAAARLRTGRGLAVAGGRVSGDGEARGTAAPRRGRDAPVHACAAAR